VLQRDGILNQRNISLYRQAGNPAAAAKWRANCKRLKVETRLLACAVQCRHRTTSDSEWVPDGRRKNMPLINIVLVLIIVGMGLWLINSFIPMAGSIKTILNAVVVVFVCVWLLKIFGLWSQITDYRVPH
jgi:hypothetical protein